MLVNKSICFFTSDSEFFFFTFPKKWVGWAMGNETFYGDGVGKLNVSNANGTNYVEIRKPTTKKDSLSFQQSSTF